MNDERPEQDYENTQPLPGDAHRHRYDPEQGPTYGDDRGAPSAGATAHQAPYGQHGYAGYGGGYGNQYGWYGQHPGQYPGQQPAHQRSGKRGKGFSAGVLVAALVLGTVGGVLGAVGVVAVDDAVNGSSSSSPGTRSTLADRPDAPAEPGSAQGVANSVLPSVVKITVQGQRGEGSGSGIVISSNGEILTNNHVVEVASGGGRLSVSFDDGSTARAEIVGTDPLTDTAVIRAQGVSGLTPATLGKSGNLDVGEQVVAIGSPFGLEATVTSGIVSALHRPVSVGSSQNATDTTYPAIQTDAAINPGNSGGPLVNMQGEVVGINSSIRTSSSSGGSGGSIGLGFAIPLDEVLPIVEQLRAGETPTHAQLGVTVSDAASQDGLTTGAGVGSVRSGSAADEAGLRNGDVVTKVDDYAISNAESLVATIRGFRPGDKVTLTVLRNGKEQTLQATLDSDGGTPAS